MVSSSLVIQTTWKLFFPKTSSTTLETSIWVFWTPRAELMVTPPTTVCLLAWQSVERSLTCTKASSSIPTGCWNHPMRILTSSPTWAKMRSRYLTILEHRNLINSKLIKNNWVNLSFSKVTEVFSEASDSKRARGSNPQGTESEGLYKNYLSF